jgi:cbb3-type cytochrome oxidase subunit 3
MDVLETAGERLVQSGVLGALLVLAIAGIVYLYRTLERERREHAAELKQQNAEKVAILVETLQRENERMGTVQRVLDVVKPGA